MNPRWVVDASLALAWVVPGQATAQTDGLLAEVRRGVTLHVPALWFQEVANALLVLQRRRKLKPDERGDILATLRALNLEPDFEGASLAFDRLSELAETHALSIYDATYLELSLRKRLPLGSNDRPLREAAEKAGVELLIR